MGFPMEETEVSDLAKETTNLASLAAKDTDFLGPVVAEETNLAEPVATVEDTVNPFAPANLKKMKKKKEVTKEGKLVLQNEEVPPKAAKDGQGQGEGLLGRKELQKGHAHYIAKALELPLLLLKDMAALKNVRQPNLFLSLKRDRALVLDLKAELEKAKEATRATKEVAKASKQKSYILEVQETEVHLAEELTDVCRDYY
nr:hypothetical protein CFP56_35549 [Quercus suber]